MDTNQKRKVVSLVRMLASDNQGEVLNSISLIKRIISFNDLAELIEKGRINGTGTITKEDMQTLYDAGFTDGRKQGFEEGKREGQRGSPFGDVLDNSNEQLRVKFCEQHKAKLKSKEREFIESIVRRSIDQNKTLTEPQLKWMNDIYRRLGGT